MKHVKDTKVIETAIIYNDESYMVWKYTNEVNTKETAIMDSTGYDVSFRTEVIEDGEVGAEAIVYTPDPEQYIHEQFVNFKS